MLTCSLSSRFLAIDRGAEWIKVPDLNTARWGRPSVGTIGGKITGIDHSRGTIGGKITGIDQGRGTIGGKITGMDLIAGAPYRGLDHKYRSY